MSQAPRLRIEPTPAPVDLARQGRSEPVQQAAPASDRPRSSVRSGMRLAASGSLVMAGAVVAVGLIEYLSPVEEFKPSYLVGTLTGRMAAAEARAAEQAKAAFTEGVKSGELRAQIAYDEKLAKIEVWKQNAVQVMQADLDRTTAAWQTAYNLTQAATQGAIQMESDMVRMRASTVAQTQGVRGAAANLMDFVGMIGALGGDRNLAQVNGDGMREEMTRSITRGGMQDAGAMAHQIMSKFPNPAQWRLEREEVLRQAFAPVGQ